LNFEEFRTGIRQGPAKELPTSLFRALRNRLTPTLLKCRLELTAVSAICLLWACYLVFKDRAACCRRDFVLPFSYFPAAPCSTSGLPSLFRGGFSVKRPLPLRFHRFASVLNQHRAAALCFFFRGGAEPTSFPRPVSTHFVDPFISPPLLCRRCDFAASRGCGFYHHRVGSQLRSSTSYSVFQSRPGVPTAVAVSPSRSRGAASTPLPHLSQPPSPTLLFPPARLCRQGDSVFVSEGARLVPPPCGESTPCC